MTKQFTSKMDDMSDKVDSLEKSLDDLIEESNKLEG